MTFSTAPATADYGFSVTPNGFDVRIECNICHQSDSSSLARAWAGSHYHEDVTWTVRYRVGDAYSTVYPTTVQAQSAEQARRMVHAAFSHHDLFTVTVLSVVQGGTDPRER